MNKDTRIARFWSKVRKIDDGCWEWTGAQKSKPEGAYGRMLIDGRLTSAHRFAYELHNGPLPPNIGVFHNCENSLCVNPCHLVGRPCGAVPVSDRFNAWVSKSPNGCWPWTGPVTTKGYGRLKILRAWVRAHRFSYQLHKGEIPKGFLVRHTCDNALCVNPAHLILGTPADNAKDMSERQRGGKCVGSSHPYAKLTETDIPTIWDLVKNQGRSKSSVAKLYGVGLSAISEIIARNRWKHVPVGNSDVMLSTPA